MKPDNYVPYHIHTMLSNGVTNIDSITDYHDYIDKAKEYNMKAFGFSEHGSLFAWLKKKEYIESSGMKYIHAIEAYLTEDDESRHIYSANDILFTAMAEEKGTKLKAPIKLRFEKYWQRDDGMWLAEAESPDDGKIKTLPIDINTLKIESDIKTRDNYHTVLIAKNYDGVKELNKLVSQSFNRKDFHYYYVPRISFKELFATSDNILITTACLGGVLNEGTPTAKEAFLHFLKTNKHRCFLEIQHHNCKEQIEYNRLLYSIHKTEGIPLIAGTDTHALDNNHIEGRAILQKAKDVKFSNEDSWDLTFKSIDELISAYEKQNSLPIDVIYEAIENTNVLANMVEDFKLDYSPKYPKLYQDSESVFKQKINEGVISRGIMKKSNYQEYLDRIHYEYDVYKHNGAIDFMLLEENYKSEMRKKNVKFGYSRGSVSGSIIAYLLYITEIDSIKYNLNFERFMNKERISLADIDTDWLSEDRKIVKDYLYGKQGLYCCDIVTFNTIALKGAIRDVCRALYKNNDNAIYSMLNSKWQKMYDEYKISCEYYNGQGQSYGMPQDLKAEIDRISGNYLQISEEIIAMCDADDEKSARKKYPDVFKYVDLVNGVVVSVGNHPAGCVVSPFPVDEWFGTFSTSTDEYPISMLNMKEIDSLNFVKLDILGLDNIGLIYKTCELAGIPFATPDNIPSDDLAVWKSIRDDTTMIFQWESQSATTYLKQLMSDETVSSIREKNPDFSYMDLLSIGNGAIRPAGASYRDELAKGIYRDNEHEALNDFLAPTLGFLVYQEQIIEFLHKFCGFTMGEADVVRRCVEENTLITMGNGSYKKIKDIEVGDIVQTENNGIITTSKVNQVFDNGKQEVYEIKCMHDYSIKATGTHKVLTQDGWKMISELTTDDYLMTPNKHLSCPVRIKSIVLCGEANVYDMEVEKTHNYIANNLIVHNCFAKKTGTESTIPVIKNGGYLSNSQHYIKGFIQTMQEKYDMEQDEAENIIKSFLQVIIDASSYLFSKNHSDPYSWIGYICGYLRYYYPLEFITTALNIFEGKEEKTIAIIEYAKKQGITIYPIKFRHSTAQYSYDNVENKIFKGISSIKYMNSAVADELYALRTNKYNSFVELLFDIDNNTTLNSRQLNILIELDFFEEFGDSNALIEMVKLYNEIGDKTQVKKEKLDKLNISHSLVKPFARKETDKMFTGVDTKQVLLEICPRFVVETKKRTLKEKIYAQLTHLGYLDIVDDKYRRMATVLSIDTKYAPKIKMYSLKNGTIIECKIDKRTFNKCKLSTGDIVRIIGTKNKPKMQKTSDGEWIALKGTSELWITDYTKIENL